MGNDSINELINILDRVYSEDASWQQHHGTNIINDEINCNKGNKTLAKNMARSLLTNQHIKNIHRLENTSEYYVVPAEFNSKTKKYDKGVIHKHGHSRVLYY